MKIPLHVIKDSELSLQAKGLLALLLQMKEEGDFNLSDMHNFSSNGPQSTQSAIKELRSSGYVEVISNKLKGRYIKPTIILNLGEKKIVPF